MADNQRLLALGDYRFSIGRAEYDAIRRVLSINWSKDSFIGGAPSYQFNGENEEVMTISGAVFNFRQNIQNTDSPVNSNGIDQITQIRDESRKGKPLRLTLDTGVSYGYWILIRVSETQSNFINTAPLKQAFDLSLKYFGESTQ